MTMPEIMKNVFFVLISLFLTVVERDFSIFLRISLQLYEYERERTREKKRKKKLMGPSRGRSYGSPRTNEPDENKQNGGHPERMFFEHAQYPNAQK